MVMVNNNDYLRVSVDHGGQQMFAIKREINDKKIVEEEFGYIDGESQTWENIKMLVQSLQDDGRLYASGRLPYAFIDTNIKDQKDFKPYAMTAHFLDRL
jgi:hypothetical protein